MATLLAGGCLVAGLALSYGPNLPAGATIILLTGAVYLVVLLARGTRRRARPAQEAARGPSKAA